MDAFTERDAALRRALAFCRSYVPTRPTERVKLTDCVHDKVRCALDVRVEKADTLQVALSLPDPDPLVLILADADRPGGCVFAGAGMQEESLFRRTALFSHLPQAMYPIAPDEALYAPDVPVLSYAGREMCRLAFIACPGIKMPSLEAGGTRLHDEDAAKLKDKVRLILQVAADRGHRSVVLGALGCGAWGCPRRHVAEIFKEVLQEEGRRPCPPTVRFAITGAGADVFADVLQSFYIL